MQRSRAIVVWLTAVFAACGPGDAPPQDSTAADESAIREMASAYSAAVADGDMEAVLSFFTDDAVIVAPDQPAVRGREALTGFMTPFFDQFTMEETIAYDEIRVVGDWAAGVYSYTFTTTPKAGGPANREEGMGMVLLRRSTDGRWQWTHTIWNRDRAVDGGS